MYKFAYLQREKPITFSDYFDGSEVMWVMAVESITSAWLNEILMHIYLCVLTEIMLRAVWCLWFRPTPIHFVALNYCLCFSCSKEYPLSFRLSDTSTILVINDLC